MQPHRRLIDLVAATAGLLIVSPLFALIAIAVKIDDGGPVFYRQERVGRGGQPFRMWKFRTMVKDADKQGPLLTVGRDRRVTRVGATLRKTKLDELPQLFNVITGEMTFVGPRPEVQRYVDLYTPEQRRVLALVPGITDEASIKHRHESEVLGRSEDPERTYVEEIMPEKIRINLEYAEHSTVASDLRVIMRTVTKILV
jgi:lipopolysaccharide/colanic/teichoic acid biosynthesis glycosyltransferase